MMPDRRILLPYLGLLVLGPVACMRDASKEETEFAPGQVWRYETRPGEEASRIVVCRVEPGTRLGTIVHVRVEGVAIRNPAAAAGVARFIGHMPFAARSLRDSVVALETVRTSLPAYEEGYETWKAAFDEDGAGIFTVSVAEGIDFVEQTLNR